MAALVRFESKDGRVNTTTVKMHAVPRAGETVALVAEQAPDDAPKGLWQVTGLTWFPGSGTHGTDACCWVEEVVETPKPPEPPNPVPAEITFEDASGLSLSFSMDYTPALTDPRPDVFVDGLGMQRYGEHQPARMELQISYSDLGLVLAERVSWWMNHENAYAAAESVTPGVWAWRVRVRSGGLEHVCVVFTGRKFTDPGAGYYVLTGTCHEPWTRETVEVSG